MHPALDASEGLAAICINETWGFIDVNGKFIIEPQFPRVGRFANGLAPAQEDGINGNKYGYIDRAGKFIMPPQFDDAESFSEGLAAVRMGANGYGDGGQWGYIDTTGQFVIPPQFQDTIGAVSSFSEGLAAVTIPASQSGYNGKTGYIDRVGRFVIPPRFNSGAGSFINGLAYVDIMFEKSTKNRLISTLAPESFSNVNYESLYRGGKFGYIDHQGEFVWEKNYD
jgi:WG containing repeat